MQPLTQSNRSYNMATLNKKYSPTKIGGWITTFVRRGRRFNLRPGQRLMLLNRRSDTTNDDFYAIAPNNILIYNNAGGGDTSIPYDKKSVIDASESVYTACGGGDPRNWSQQSVNSAVDQFLPIGGKAKATLDEIGEKLNHQTRGDGRDYGAGINQGMPLDVWNNSAPRRWYSERAASRISQVTGSTFYGGYEGHLVIGVYWHEPDANRTMAKIREALNSPQKAYELCKANPCFGNDFYSNDAHTYRDGAIKAYDAGDPNKPPLC